jgi:hypothetical protein
MAWKKQLCLISLLLKFASMNLTLRLMTTMRPGIMVSILCREQQCAIGVIAICCNPVISNFLVHKHVIGTQDRSSMQGIDGFIKHTYHYTVFYVNCNVWAAHILWNHHLLNKAWVASHQSQVFGFGGGRTTGTPFGNACSSGGAANLPSQHEK